MLISVKFAPIIPIIIIRKYEIVMMIKVGEINRYASTKKSKSKFIGSGSGNATRRLGNN
jgi:hypothetical protein